jgi:SAM-dependent methyltransferase
VSGPQVRDDPKQRVRLFWEAHPVGARLNPHPPGSPAFFEEARRIRYSLEPHILGAIDFPRWAGKRVLEIGCGLGTDAAEFCRVGASYTGMDLTDAAARLTRAHLAYRQCRGSVIRGDAERLPFRDAAFDLVFSHGVLHHTPDTAGAVREVHRVLRPDGLAAVMVYHRHSWNYWGNILVLRRLGALVLRSRWGPAIVSRLTGEDVAVLEEHQRRMLAEPRYFSPEVFLRHNTDGPGNPISKVYSRAEARDLFRGFARVETRVYHLNLRSVPLLRRVVPQPLSYRLGRGVGWHLWVYATKGETAPASVP